MKFLFLLFFPFITLAANVKITELPSGTPSGVASNDVFPYVSVSAGVTRKLTIGDLINVPTISGAFLSSSLDNGYVLVGNSLGAATGVPLSGDASISNAGALTVNSVGGSTAANINTATTLAIGSTSINTPSTIIRRDASGNFAAGTMAGLATTASAFAANPADCSANSYATGIAANGDLTCTTLVGKVTGEVFMTAATSCPSGSIAANGASVLRTGGTECGGGSCAALFAAISTTYGSASGTTFTLPDMRGVFARGAGSQTISAISYTGTQGTTQGDQSQGHYHSVSDPGHNHTQNSHNHTQDAHSHLQQATNNGIVGGTNTLGPGSGTNFTSTSATASTTATNQAATATNNSNTTGLTVTAPSSDGSSGTPRTGSETRPANITLLYCIVY